MTHIHMGISVRGLLSRLGGTKKEQRAATAGFSINGRPATVEQVREWLFDHLAQGHEKVPMAAEPCDAWDWTDGCKGHRDVSLQDGPGE